MRLGFTKCRYIVNPMSVAKIKLEMPRTPQAARVWKEVTKMSEFPIQIVSAQPPVCIFSMQKIHSPCSLYNTEMIIRFFICNFTLS